LRQAVLSGSIVVPGDGDRLMPLVRGNVVGYDAARMTFEFTMLTPDAKMVGCTISSAALDFWAGQKGTYPAERESQFVRLRDTIEQFASKMFDDTNGGVPVRIFLKHILPGKKPRRLSRT
jgi:hypothetical protein